MASLIEELPAHLEATYGVGVKKMAPLEPWGPEGAQRVDLDNGESWVARPHGPARPVEEVHGDAEILRFLEEHDFPAERLARDQPVSTYGSASVIVTKLLPGHNCRSDTSPATLNGIGKMLGRLHTLPAAEGAVSRPAGGWHHLSQAGGGRDEDVRALLPVLSAAAQRLGDSERAACKELMIELESIDLCRDLPHCLINVDFGGPNIIKWRDTLSAIDWTGAGRGPRIHSLAILGHGDRDPRLLDAIIDGYRDYVRLEPEELDRLPGSLVVHWLVLQAWGVAFRGSAPSNVLRGLAHERESSQRIAEMARVAFGKKTLAGWERARAGAASPSPQSQLQILANAVNGKPDNEIEAFANQIGGMEQLCAMVFRGLASSPKPDCNVGFILGDTMGWVVRSAKGKATVTKRVAKRAPAIVHTSPTDFLRIVTRDLDWDTGVAEGRIKVEGDPGQVATLFGVARA